MIAARKRPRFLLDLAEELTWLNQKAGPEVAERWYQELKKTIRFLRQHPLSEHTLGHVTNHNTA